MNWYKLAQEYKTKERKPITFQEFPFSETKDKRGWICHDIKAFVDGEEAGYIKMSYIPKEKWEEIYHGNIWIFRKFAMGHYDVSENFLNATDEEIAKDHFEKYYGYATEIHPEDTENNKKQAQYWVENEREKAEREYKLYYLYFVDKPLVDFIRTNEKFRRQRIAYTLHQYANKWLKEKFGLKLWLSYCRTDNGKCFYDSKLLDLKKYKYQQQTKPFRRTREYMAENKDWYKKQNLI